MNHLSRQLEHYIVGVTHCQQCVDLATHHVRHPRIAVQAIDDIRSELARLRTKLVEHQAVVDRTEDDHAQRSSPAMEHV